MARATRHGGMAIIGGGRGGARAAVAFRENGYDGQVTLVGEEDLAPYDRPPLSKSNITEEAEPAPALLLDEGMIASLKVDFIQSQARAIDPQARTIALADGSELSYEKLLLATGARARALPFPGADRALSLRDFGEMQALRAALRRKQSVAVIGGGFIGLELASSAAKLGSPVTVIEAQPRILMRGVPEEIAAIIEARHRQEGVELVTSASIAEIGERTVTLSTGRAIPADIVIAGIGAVPRTELAKGAGLAIDNGIACDGRMQTSDPHIHAVGDCCSFPHPVFGGLRMRLESWRAAADQAIVACANMLGNAKDYESVPWFWSDQYELTLQIAGLPQLGLSSVARRLKDDALILCHLDAEGRLVGASGVGPGNSIARDVRLLELLVGKKARPEREGLADPAFALRSLLKG